jgi:hypothetical protein
MTIRAEEIWEAFCGELIVEPTEDMKEALAIADAIYKFFKKN